MQPGNEQYDPRPPQAQDLAPKRARIGLILLIAFLTELIVIVVVGNQAVTNRIQRHSYGATLKGGLARTFEVYSWRFTPVAHDTHHFWAASLTLIGATIVISLLLILVIVRGPVTFGRAFFGAWLAVIVATMLGAYLRALVADQPADVYRSRLGRVLFGQLSPGSTQFLAGLGLGLIVALVVAIIAVTTRRVPRRVTEPAREPATEPGFDPASDPAFLPGGAYATDPGQSPYEPRRPGEPGGVQTSSGAPWQDQYHGPPQRDTAPAPGAQDSARTTALPAMSRSEGSSEAATATSQLPAVEAHPEPASYQGEQTTQLPRAQDAAPVETAPVETAPVETAPVETAPGQQAEVDQSTTQFPRPPDDEDMDPEHH